MNEQEMEKNNTSDTSIKDFNLKVDIKGTLFIGLGFFTAMVAWSYYNFKIPIILNGVLGPQGEWTRIGMLGTESYMELIGGALMTLDNIIAIMLQPYFGQLSDKMQSKFGRRTPFVIIGIPTAVFCLFILPFCGILGLFIAVILVFNLAMAFYRPPVMSILPDKTPPQILSSANSFISLMGGLGIVAGMLAPALSGTMPNSTPTITGVYETQDFFWQDFWGFFFTGLIMAISLLIFLWKVKEVSTGDKFWHIGDKSIQIDVYTQKRILIEDYSTTEVSDSKENKVQKGFFDDFNDIRKDEEKSALYILLAVFFYLFGFNAIEFSFGRYATSYFGITEGSAGLLISIMPVMLILSAIPAGKLAEKHGRRKIMKIGLIITGICCIGIMIAAPITRQITLNRDLTFMDLIPLMGLLSFAGLGYGFTHINALPVVWQLAPKKKIGAYTGVYYMVSALGSILSPLFMSAIYWGIRESGGNQWGALFPYYLFGLIIGYFFVYKTHRGDAEPLSKEELKNLKSQFQKEDL